PVLAPRQLGRAQFVKTLRLAERGLREGDSQPELRGDRRVVPLRAVVRAQDLDQVRGTVPRHLGDHPVAVLGRMRTAPAERAHAGPALRGVETPTAAREVRAAEES